MTMFLSTTAERTEENLEKKSSQKSFADYLERAPHSRKLFLKPSEERMVYDTSEQDVYYVKKGTIIKGFVGSIHTFHQSIFTEGDYFFLSSDPLLAHTSVPSLKCIEKAELIRVPNTSVLSILKNEPQFFKEYTSLLTNHLKLSEVDGMLFHYSDATIRCICALIKYGESYPEHLAPLNRLELSYFSNTSRETFTRVLLELKQEQFLTTPRHKIEIPHINWEKLSQIYGSKLPKYFQYRLRQLVNTHAHVVSL